MIRLKTNREKRARRDEAPADAEVARAPVEKKDGEAASSPWKRLDQE